MYRKLILPAISLFIISCMAIFAFVQDFYPNKENGNTMYTSLIETDSRQPAYRIGAYDGYIAVYLPQENLPCLQTDISLRTLRNKDQQKIVQGIYLYSEEELTSFLEDYGS